MPGVGLRSLVAGSKANRLTSGSIGFLLRKHQYCCSLIDLQYWFSAKEAPSKQSLARRVHMLPLYDEYFIACKDRSAAVHPAANSLQGKTSFVFDPPMVMDGRSVGVWERALGRSSVKIKLQPFIRLKSRDKEDFREAAASYAEFLGKDLELLSDTG